MLEQHFYDAKEDLKKLKLNALFLLKEFYKHKEYHQ